MPRLTWSPPALADVQRLYRFLALKDENVARYAIKTIRAGVKILTRKINELGMDDETREDSGQGCD